LENLIEHAFVLCGEGEIETKHLPAELVAHLPHRSRLNPISASTQALEAKAIMDALTRNDFNRLATARDLGIHKSTLFRKIRALGLELPSQDGRARTHRKR